MAELLCWPRYFPKTFRVRLGRVGIALRRSSYEKEFPNRFHNTNLESPPLLSSQHLPDINCPRQDAGYHPCHQTSIAGCCQTAVLLYLCLRCDCPEPPYQQGHQGHLSGFHWKAGNVRTWMSMLRRKQDEELHTDGFGCTVSTHSRPLSTVCAIGSERFFRTASDRILQAPTLLEEQTQKRLDQHILIFQSSPTLPML